MGLRAKLAIALLGLLATVVCAMSALQIGRTMNLMVKSLEHDGDLLIGQAFEQVRTILAGSHDDPALALRKNPGLRALLESSRAFGQGVVYARIEGPGGSIVLSEPAQQEATAGGQMVQPFSRLKENASSWRGLARLYMPWTDSTYELSRPFLVNDKPFGVIAVGLSTALTAAELHRSVREIAFFASVALALGVAAAMILGGVLLRPVVAISAHVEALVAGHETRTVRVGGSDELSTLAERFNQLSQRINRDRTQWERERGQLFNVFRSIADAVMLLDASGAILFANGEAIGRLGLPAGGVAEGKPLQLLLGKKHPLVRMIDAVYATRTEAHDVALQLSDGASPVRLLVSVFSLGQGPEQAGLLVIARDLEPLQELESVVDHSERLARLGALISGVAHQIRNPLNAMNLQLELLNQDAERGRPIDARVDSIRGQIRHLGEAVDAMMRFMRPETLRLEEIGLNDLIVEVGSQVARPGIRIEYEFDPHVMYISADRALLGEALRNVASNAAEAMPHGGTLTLGTLRKDDRFVEIFIADQGKGIPPGELDRIFEPYFTTKPSGLGLGLSLATRAIDLHRGTLDVQSELGKGTTVKIRLAIESRPDDSLSSASRT